jgi:cysteine desulfurase
MRFDVARAACYNTDAADQGSGTGQQLALQWLVWLRFPVQKSPMRKADSDVSNSYRGTALSDSIYLDYAATTPVDPRVVDAMQPYWTEVFGNNASIHSQGRSAAKALESARAQVAGVLGCHPTEVIFTANGTEGNNLAVRGVAFAARNAARGNHLVTSAIEHHAVSHTIDQLRDEFGFEATVVPVDGQGMIDPSHIKQAIRKDTILVSVMYANNEVGTVQPLAEIGRIARTHNIPFHTDAVQASGKLNLNVDHLGADLLTLSAHKFYGPKGVGALFVRRGTMLFPALTGGGQERGLRPGTVNVPGNVGLATALQLIEEKREHEARRLIALRDRLIDGVLSRIPGSRLTGHPTMRLADNASFAFHKCDGEALLMALDLAGIAASTGSACTTGDPEPSFVLTAMGLEPEWAIGSLRLSLGHWTTEEHIERVIEVLPSVVERTRALQKDLEHFTRT